MENEEYIAIQYQLFALAGVLADLDLDEFLRSISRAEALSPILDPTLYRAAMGNMEKIKDLARAAREFQKVAREVR